MIFAVELQTHAAISVLLSVMFPVLENSLKFDPNTPVPTSVH